MIIKGLQKLTLIDYPEKLACTIFLYGCNLRCGFCHNPRLVTNPEGPNYTEKEILDFLEKRKKYLDAVCITGGEPLLTLKTDFIKKIKQKGYLIKIDTNGCFPERLKELIDLNLIDYIAMDIKSSKEKYKELVNSNINIKKIEESIKIISNFKNHEFRTTVLESYHNPKEIQNMLNWIKSITNKKLKAFYLQGFKNEEKLLDISFKDEPDTKEEYLNTLQNISKDYCDKVEIRI